MLAARKAYAEHHGLLLENVTPDMVNADAAGAVYWATKNLNLSARGPTARQWAGLSNTTPKSRRCTKPCLTARKCDSGRLGQPVDRGTSSTLSEAQCLRIGGTGCVQNTTANRKPKRSASQASLSC